MTGLKPVLAETIADGRLQHYIDNDLWDATQKLDGMRLLVHVTDGQVEFLQRQGKPTAKAVHAPIVREFEQITNGEWYFDGELIATPGIGAVLWLFDMPLALDKVAPDDPYEDRKAMLDGFHDAFFAGSTTVRLLPAATGADDKALLVKRVQENGGEGVMFKHLEKSYDQPRNPNASAGVRSRWVLKAKNWNSVDCVVLATRLDGKDNMQLGVYDPTYKGKTAPFRPIGECTALAGDGGSIVKGMVVEVKYLYTNDPRAPRLYQPTKPMIRTDKAPEECTIDQLVFCNKGVLT